MSKNKGYNPFLMWGSYLGIFIAFLWPPLQLVIDKIQNPTYNLGMCWSCYFKPNYFAFWFIPLGFLLGWGIHSLFRKLN